MSQHRLRGAGTPWRAATALSLSLVPAATVAPPAMAADELPPVVVEADRPATAAPATVATPADADRGPAADLGAYLSTLPFVSAGRMGGHGQEITLRGQSQDRLAVINDGAYTFGGCPNRMDPPTSSAPLEAADRVVVTRGYQSVLDGPPAPGGTIAIERATPRFSEAGVTGSLSGGIGDNGTTRFGAADITAGAAAGYVRAFTGARRADDYADGNGRTVRSSFRQFGGGAEAGWTYAPDSVLSVSAEQSEETDVLFAGAGMDSPDTDTVTYRAKWRHALDGAGVVQAVEGSLYTSLVDHRMDNFSLRVPTTPMKMLTLSESDTSGGRLAADLAVGAATVTLGADHRVNVRDAVSTMGMAALPGDPTMVSGYMWPDMSIADTGLFAQAEVPLATATTLTAGARLDVVQADARRAGAVPPAPGAMSARALYASYYGTADTSREEANVSGLMRLGHDFGGGVSGWLGGGRAVRTADATERGIARSAGASSWVGNPGLDPEKHHQVDAGLAVAGQTWRTEATVWGDVVNDFITRDTARGQPGVLMANGASIFRNVDATLAGAELAGQWRPINTWRLAADVAYTWGENTSDDRPLYQIPPLQGTVEAAWQPAALGLDAWEWGGRLRWALSQSRVDDDPLTGAGLDVRETPAYGAFDLFTSYSGIDGVVLRAGVNNLFNEAYATHLSRSNGVDPMMVQVNEPGRAFYLQGRVEF